jgi:hypothetical protein
MLRRRFGSSKEDWKEDLSDANEWKKIPEKHWLIALNKPLDEDMHKLYCTIPEETRMRLFDLCSGIMMNEEKEKEEVEREERERAEQSKRTWDALDATSTSPIVTAFRLQPSSRYAENETRNKVERMQWDLLTAREEMKEAQADEAPASDDEVSPFPRLADCQTCEYANDIKQTLVSAGLAWNEMVENVSGWTGPKYQGPLGDGLIIPPGMPPLRMSGEQDVLKATSWQAMQPSHILPEDGSGSKKMQEE